MDVQFGWGAHEDGYWRKGPWTAQEDKLLIEHVNLHGEGRWNSVSTLTGLRRSGKSCRLRWVNYLRPDLKRGKMTPEEENTIHELHALWGNRWSTIARSLPGRTDNEIKNYWRTHFKKNKPSKKVERARATFLMQQKEQQRQKKKAEEEQQQPQHQQEEEKADVSMMMSMHADEITRLAEDMEDMATSSFMCPLSGYWLLDISDGSTDQEDQGSWGCLWNLDGVNDGVDDLLRHH